MHLIGEVLDKQIVNRNGQYLGKVDGLIITVGRGRPCVTQLETGGTVLATRIHSRLGAWAAALRRRWGDGDPTPERIPWSHVDSVGITVTVDADARTSRARAWERWLRRHVVSHIPGH